MAAVPLVDPKGAVAVGTWLSKLRAEFKAAVPDEITGWALPTLRTLATFTSDPKSLYCAVGAVEVQQGIPAEQAFEPENPLFPKGGVVFLLRGDFRAPARSFDHLLVVLGPEAVLAAVKSLTSDRTRCLSTSGFSASSNAVKAKTETKILTSISPPTLMVYNTDEEGLFTILAHPTHGPLEKIGSLLLFLYPYTRVEIAKIATIVDVAGPSQTGGRPSGKLGAAGDPEKAKTNFALLALYLLGPAYSLETKLGEQLARRAKAAAAAGGFDCPDANAFNGLIGTARWRTSELRPEVADLLATAICVNNEGNLSHTVRTGDLIPLETLGREHKVSEVGLVLLEQARLVYQKYHATSVSFVAAVIEPLQAKIPLENPIYGPEYTKFEAIRDDILNCPYLGLRSKLPEKYQINQIPHLVGCGLLYYKNNLPSEEDKKAFESYKVKDVLSHVANQNDQVEMEVVVGECTTVATQAISNLVKTMSLENAERFFASKDATLKKEVLETLRPQQGRGPWAENQVATEEANIKLKLATEARDLLKEMLESKYTAARDATDRIPDPAERLERMAAITTLRSRIEKDIEALTPIEERLSHSAASAHIRLRTEMATTIRGIADRMAF